MIDTERISISQKPQVDRIRAAGKHAAESHSFQSLFLWQRDMGLTIRVEDEAFYVKCTTRKGNCWYFPCGNRGGISRWIETQLSAKEPLHLIYLREEDVQFLESQFSEIFMVTAVDGDSEYLYDRAAYLNMEGEAYRRIRRAVRKLLAENKVHAEVWTKENTGDMEKVLRQWHAHAPGEDGLVDWGTSELLQQHGKALDMTGVITYLDGNPVSMAAGFPLDNESFDIAFSKSCVPLTGLQDFTRQALVRLLPAQFKILNGEDDLGIPGIRKVKQLMRPVDRIRMFEAWQR